MSISVYDVTTWRAYPLEMDLNNSGLRNAAAVMNRASAQPTQQQSFAGVAKGSGNTDAAASGSYSKSWRVSWLSKPLIALLTSFFSLVLFLLKVILMTIGINGWGKLRRGDQTCVIGEKCVILVAEDLGHSGSALDMKVPNTSRDYWTVTALKAIRSHQQVIEEEIFGSWIGNCCRH